MMEIFLIIVGIVFLGLLAGSHTKSQTINRSDATGSHTVTYSTEEKAPMSAGDMFCMLMCAFFLVITGFGIFFIPMMIENFTKKKNVVKMDYRHRSVDGYRHIVAEVPKTERNKHLVD
jgi:hypothetical protein